MSDKPAMISTPGSPNTKELSDTTPISQNSRNIYWNKDILSEA
jgi:hypothetical protein